MQAERHYVRRIFAHNEMKRHDTSPIDVLIYEQGVCDCNIISDQPASLLVTTSADPQVCEMKPATSPSLR